MSHHDRMSRRTGPMLAMGILNMVVGGFSTFAATVALVLLFTVVPSLTEQIEELQRSGGGPVIQDGQAPQHASPTTAWAAPVTIANLVFAVMLMVSGGGLIAMRPWGRSIALGVCWVGLALGVVVTAARLIDQRVPDVGFIEIGYSILCIVLLMSREWRAAYAPSPDLGLHELANTVPAR